MKTFKLALIIAFATFPAAPKVLSAQEMDPAPVKAFCAEKWDGDFSMQRFCTDQIEQGFATYVEQHAIARDATLPDLTTALNNCESKWHPQWDMVAFCGKQNIDGILEVTKLTTGLPQDVKEIVVHQCAEKWGTDFSMIAFCTKQQAQAWRDIQ